MTNEETINKEEIQNEKEIVDEVVDDQPTEVEEEPIVHIKPAINNEVITPTKENITVTQLQKLVNKALDDRELKSLLDKSPYKLDIKALGLSYNKALLYIKMQEEKKSIENVETKSDNVVDAPSKLVEGSTTTNTTSFVKKITKPSIINNMTNEERKLYFSTR